MYGSRHLELVRSSLAAQARELSTLSNTNVNVVLASEMEKLPTHILQILKGSQL